MLRRFRMRNYFFLFLVMACPSASFAENLTLLRGNDVMSYLIDEDSIEKIGQYYQANLFMKIKVPEQSEIDGKVVTFDLQKNLYKFNCANHSNFLAKVTNYYKEELVSSDFNPRSEKFEIDKSGMTEYVCDNFLLKK